MKLSAMLSTFVLSALLAAGTAQATAQQGDILIVDGKEETIYTNPLSEWLEMHPKALPEGDVVSTANWRGYVATWEVAGGKLWLRRVEVTYADGKETAMTTGLTQDEKGRWVATKPEAVEMTKYVQRDVRAKLFPDRNDVVADWYTGTLILPKGEIVDYVHMGYGSTYERYTVIWVRKGEVAKQLDLRADQFMELRKERFKAYKQSDEYKKQLARLAKDSDAKGQEEDAKRLEGFLFEFEAERYLSIDPSADSD